MTNRHYALKVCVKVTRMSSCGLSDQAFPIGLLWLDFYFRWLDSNRLDGIVKTALPKSSSSSLLFLKFIIAKSGIGLAVREFVCDIAGKNQ